MKSLLRTLAVVVVVVVGAAIVLPMIARSVPKWGLFQSSAETKTTSLVNAITREEKVVLLSLGIQGITESTDRSTLLGVDVPGSGRTTFLQYGFSAKLGIDAREVVVEQISAMHLRINVPEFIFIGHSDETFKLVAESNGVLSWVTPEIDTAALITEILNEEGQLQYVDGNREILEDQTRAFYEGIVRAVDPAVEVEIVFA